MQPSQDATTFTDYPKKLTVALTDRCNLKCFICVREEFEIDTGGRGEHMPLSELHKLEAPIRHAEVIQLSGFGESFLYPHLNEALDYIYETNPRDDLIYMITNGTLLSREWGERLDGRLNYLAISLNAANPDEYRRDMFPYLYRYTRQTAPEAYRGKQFAEDNDRERPCEFDRTVSRIKDFMQGLGEHSRQNVGLHYVVHSENIGHLSDFVELARAIGITKVEFNPYLVNRVENIEKSIFFHKETFNAELDRAQALAERYGIRVLGRKFGSERKRTFNHQSDCRWPFDEALVFTRGDVGACCFAGRNKMGNAFADGEDFDGIWFGTEYQRLRRERWFDACQRCNLFHTIDDWQTHFSPRVKTSQPYREVAGRFEDEAVQHATRVLVVGAGRDGSRSIARLLQNLYMAQGETVDVLHQADSFRTLEAVTQYLGDGDGAGLQEVVEDWRQEIVAGGGFGFALPIAGKVHGRGLKVVYLVRDRDACIRSLSDAARRDPLYWAGYVEAPQSFPDEAEAERAQAAIKPVRPTAPLTGDMTARQWLALDIEARLGWYYDTVHAAIEAELGQFTSVLRLSTEELNDARTVEALAEFMSLRQATSLAPVHINSAAYRIGGPPPPELEGEAQELFADLDIRQMLATETYAVTHFLQRWMRRHGDKPGPEMIAELACIAQSIDEVIEAVNSASVAPLDARLVEDRLRELPEGMLGTDRASQRGLIARLVGIDWPRMTGDPVYPMAFFIRRMAELHAAGGQDADRLLQTLEFFREQIGALHKRLDDLRAAQAAA